MKYSSIWIVVAAFALIAIGCHTQQVVPNDAGSSCSQTPNELTAAMFNSWFETGAVSLNGAVKPANSVLFPDVPNCSFYQWSEQMFLWLTSPAPPRYGSNGLVMNTPAFYDVSLPDADGNRHFLPHQNGHIRIFNLRTAQKGGLDLPVVLEKKTLRLLEILPPIISPSGKQLILNKEGNEVEVNTITINKNNQLVLTDDKGNEIQSPRAILQSAKDTTVSLLMKKMRKIDNFDKTTLVQKFTVKEKTFFLDLFGNFHETEQGQADGNVLMAQNGSLVYYSLTVNNVFALYRTMMGASVPAGTKFPITQAELNSITAFAASHGQPPVIDDIALAVEIKCSWIEAAGLPDADKFIKMKAEVPVYDKTNPNNWVPTGATHVIELAMTGMHVVGSTGSTNAANPNHGHPEMLWATFEHVSNVPSATYDYLNNTGGVTNVPQNTAGNWLFCSNGSTGPFNQSRMAMGGASGMEIVALSGHTIGPSDIRREMPWGLNGTNSTGNAEVISTNHTVRSLLNPNDVRNNYIQTGTTWTIFGASPNAGNQVGTNKLSNCTMETFTQGGNCFNCHHTNTTTVSHIFDETLPLF